MASRHLQTIFALSSGALPSGIAVIRLSGAQVAHVVKNLCGQLPAPRRAVLKWIRDRNGLRIDHGLVIYFPAPNSFTGEDCAELHLHGGRAVVAAILQLLGDFDDLRPAEAGEFTRRAFMNGKLDLVEIEGLADLIQAETEMQRRFAIQQADGGLSALYLGWARRLTHARAMIEAELDFADESDVPGSVSDQIWTDMEALSGDIGRHIAGTGAAEIIRDGLNVVIAGQPNSGKSSLINYLAKRDVAIVTDIAGTTRDVLSVDLDIGGYAVRLSDTAGLRASDDVVEKQGVARALRTIENADLVLLLSDAQAQEDRLQLTTSAKVINVVSKIDLLGEFHPRGDEVGISVKTGKGIDSLLKRILECLKEKLPASQSRLPIRIRHIHYLRSAKSEIESALLDSKQDQVLRAEALRRAAHELGKITGKVDAEDLLDVIFSSFCIGK